MKKKICLVDGMGKRVITEMTDPVSEKKKKKLKWLI